MKPRTVLAWAVIFFSTFLCTADVGRAQSTTGSIVGAVTDTSGGVLPGVEITVTREETSETRTTVTGDSGTYAVASLSPGTYRVTARLDGFQTTTVEDLILQISQDLRVDIQLPVGGITDEVSVLAEGTMVESETASTGQIIDAQRVVDLPLNGRNFVQLATLSAGSVPLSESSRSFSMSSLYTGRSNQSANIAGGREGHNIFMIDGVPNVSSKWGGVGITPSVDAIQEFKVQHTFFGAEFGQGSSIVNVAIKSGTNSFHGTVFEFLRNDILDARQWQDRGSEALPFKRNQFGFTLGGPIQKDTTFFFVNYEGLRTRRANTLQGIVPTDAMLAGDFSGLAPIYDPETLHEDPDAPLGLARDQFPNNQIPQDRFSHVAQVLTSYFPSPNVSGSGPGEINYIIQPSAKNDFDQVNTRIDHVFSESDRIFGRFSWMDSIVTQPAAMPLSGLVLPLDGYNLAIQETHIFSPTLLNEFRFGYNRTRQNFSQEGAGEENFAETLGWQNLTDDPPSFGLPAVLLVGFSGLGPTSSSPINSLTENFQFVDNLIWTSGNHKLKFGTEITPTIIEQVTENGSRGILLFQGLSTTQYVVSGGGSPIADFLLGTPLAVQSSTGLSPANFRSTFLNFYIQDDWTVNSKVTLNLGLRYEYNTPYSVEDAAFTYFDFASGDLVVATNETNQIVFPDRNNFAPRIGLAYRPFGNNKTAIRAGWGIYYTRVEINELELGRNAPPFNLAQTIFGFPAGGPALLDADNLFPEPTIGTLSILTHQRDARRPYTQQFGLSVQRELSRTLMFDVAYTGTLGYKLNLRRNANQMVNPDGTNSGMAPYPNFGQIVYASRDGTSSYHGARLKLEKRFSRGLSFLASYTYSKAMDTLSTVGGNNGQGIMNNALRPDLERALASFDARNRFVFSYSYDLPFGAGRHFLSNASGFTDHLLGGWKINGIASFSSGFPVSVLQNGDPSGTGLFVTSRPDRIADGNLPSDQRNPNGWFDTTAFAVNEAGVLGNAGRNIITGPGSQVVDFSLFKNFGVTEGLNIEFRTEFFNLLNRPNFNLPETTLQLPTFGQVLSAGHAREIQFGFKVIF